MEGIRSLNPSEVSKLFWGLVKTEAVFADGFERECLESIAADMGPKLLSFSPRVSEPSHVNTDFYLIFFPCQMRNEVLFCSGRGKLFFFF